MQNTVPTRCEYWHYSKSFCIIITKPQVNNVKSIALRICSLYMCRCTKGLCHGFTGPLPYISNLGQRYGGVIVRRAYMMNYKLYIRKY